MKTYVVDQNVDLAEFLDGRSDCGVDGVVVTNISGAVDDLASGREALEFLLESCELVLGLCE